MISAASEVGHDACGLVVGLRGREVDKSKVTSEFRSAMSHRNRVAKADSSH